MQLYYDVGVPIQNTITARIEKYGELVNKLFSWALVRQVATLLFIEVEACIKYLAPWLGTKYLKCNVITIDDIKVTERE